MKSRHKGRHKLNEDSAKERIFNILLLLSSQEKNGIQISKKELMNILPNIDQSTIYRDTKQLEKEKRIKILRKGQRTNYIVVEDSTSLNVRLGAFLLNRKFVSSILGKDSTIRAGRMRVKEKSLDPKDNTRFINSRWYIETKKCTEDEHLVQVEQTLFKLANQIGAYAIKVFIQAMNPDYIMKILKAHSKTGEEYEEEENSLARWWINDAIGPSTLIEMFHKFRNLLEEQFGFIPAILPAEGEKMSEKGPKNYNKELGYRLDKQPISELAYAFGNLYQDIDTRLDEIMINLKEDLDWTKDTMLQMRKGKNR